MRALLIGLAAIVLGCNGGCNCAARPTGAGGGTAAPRPSTPTAGAEGLDRVALPRSFPQRPVEMIVGRGMWPPTSTTEVRERVEESLRDGATVLVADTGLTELYRAYEDPTPFLQVVKRAAGEGRRVGLSTAFYLPAFEIRREKQTRGGRPLARWRPEWPQRTLDGRPWIKTAFGKDEFWNREGDEVMFACPSSPWRAVFIDRVTRAVRGGARTLFIDVPYFQATDKHRTCRCRHCQARFKKDTGLSIPTRPAPGNRAYHRWIWWRHQVLAAFFAEIRAAIRGVDPAARLVVEEYPGYLEGETTATGVDPGLIGDEVDLFAHEYSARQFENKPLTPKDRLELAATLALLTGLDGDRPTWVLSYAHRPTDSRAAAALHLCYDASFWETKAPEMNDTTVDRKWRRELFRWFATHRAAFGGTRQLARVAVLYSPASRDFSDDHFPQLMDTVRTLVRAGVPFRVLSTRDMDEARRYPVLVLPSVSALSERDAVRLRAHPGRRLVLGRAPDRGPLGIEPRDHGLEHREVELSGLVQALGAPPVQVRGAPLAVNLVARRGEIQLRLAPLSGGRANARVRLVLPAAVQGAAVLPFLGGQRPLPLQGPLTAGAAVSFSVQVDGLTVVRLRTR